MATPWNNPLFISCMIMEFWATSSLALDIFYHLPFVVKTSQGSQTHAGKIYRSIKVANYNKAFAHLKFVFTFSGLVEVLYKTHYHATWFACNYHYGPHALKFEMRSLPSLIWICLLYCGILKHWGWGLHCKWWLYFYIGSEYTSVHSNLSWTKEEKF